ncbi:regulation of nuclear pre-mRNA domain-containing protein 2 isoform X2 [Pectinophora gossypiella]|uniref:regulation of nuclear pre-mRNA domain-containing protein 2 isoform X2 n=1 Tax=Pectinophora gossypiella TaxID=13191 RepID=UPI00214F562D|nr:regulation of nuclear pre-mRNA domain-containing protein 2 isoform X2 [Pectinophora gossypiella]
MGDTEEFNTLAFEKRLAQLKDTQESIQSLSSWCLKQREHHKKIVASWLNVLKRVKVEQRLVLFYLANDVIQYSKRKNYEFVESWGLNLQKATPLVRDEKVRHKILRIFKIWEQRSVYDEEFLSDLTGLLSAGAVKKTDDDPLDFQPQQLVNKIKQCTVLEADTDLRLKYIHESHLQLSDADALCASLKDRSNKDDVEKELNEGIQCVERYTQALQREIVAREALLALLTTANQYYSTQRGEVKVVAYAYKNFGARVRALKRKLDELIPTLPNAAPSPPQRDEDVPSPGPDEDLDLPTAGENEGEDDISYNIDQTFNTSMSADGSLYNLGLSSFLTSDNPMAIFNDSDISANKIEVINSRPNEKQDFDINNFLKTLVPNESNQSNSDNSSVHSSTLPQKGASLPGLDLLTPDGAPNPAPPTSFYGTTTITDDPEPYHPELNTQWNNNSAWSIPPAPVPPPLLRGVFPDTPESPPPQPPQPPPPRAPVYPHTQDIPPADVDHRGILPPPPPPPVLPLLGNMEDVDHRLLPTLPPPPLPNAAVRHPTGQQDVDHRNLISLTHQPPRPIAPVVDLRPAAPKIDQDYRVPPMVPPSDIVESVDMDLSEDEDQRMYQNQNEHRRNSFNNNKVLVGGDNGKTHRENHKENHSLVQINREFEGDQFDRDPVIAPHSAPILPPLSNPFDNMPVGLKTLNMPSMQLPFNKSFPPFPREEKEDNSNDSAYEEERRLELQLEGRNQPSPEFENFNESEWQQRPFNNQRFPRNWGPRTNFRPPFGPQMWPRNGPRPPNRWMGPRQRFW